jgi:adenosylhomocysteinase
VVVAGYGWCGKGVAMRAKGLGAEIIVTEVDPVKAMEAVMDGFKVMPMLDAAAEGDFFVTVTGCADVIGPEAFLRMKDGAICCNAGHFDVEVAVARLKAMAVSHKPARNNIEAYTLENGRTIFVIAEGRLVNLAAGDGHPAEIMDMSFAIQALSARYLADNRGKLNRKLNNVPVEIDREVAFRKLADWGIKIDTLTPEQHKYLYGE